MPRLTIVADIHANPDKLDLVKAELEKLWQAHMNAPHLAAYMAATEGAVAEFTLNEMSLVMDIVD